MSAFLPVIASSLTGFLVSKVVGKATGNKTLAAIAGVAAGGWAGSYASSALASGNVGPSGLLGHSSVNAGNAFRGSASSLGGLGESAVTHPYQPNGGMATKMTPLASGGEAQAAAIPQPFSEVAQSGIATGAPGTPGAPPVAGAGRMAGAGAQASANTATTAAAGGGKGLFGSLSNDEFMKLVGATIQGAGSYLSNNDMVQLRQDEFDFKKNEIGKSSAWGVDRNGNGAPLDAGRAFGNVNKRLWADGYSAFAPQPPQPQTGGGLLSMQNRQDEPTTLNTLNALHMRKSQTYSGER